MTSEPIQHADDVAPHVLVVRALRLMHDALADVKEAILENDGYISDWHNAYAAEVCIETLEAALNDGELLVAPSVGGDVGQPLASVGRFDEQGCQSGVGSEDQGEHVPVGNGVIEADHSTIMPPRQPHSDDGADDAR